MRKTAIPLIAALLADLGLITSGHMKNSGNTAAIRLSGTEPLPATNFIDFTATGTQSFIKHAGIDAKANGDLTIAAVKFSGAGSTPTLSNQSPGWPSIAITGTDSAHRVTFTAASGATISSGLQCTVTFATAFAAVPIVVNGIIDNGGVSFKWYLGNVTASSYDIYIETGGATPPGTASKVPVVVFG